MSVRWDRDWGQGWGENRAASAVQLTLHLAAGDCKWTYQQNQSVIAALKKENKDLKALLAQLPASNTSGKVDIQLTWPFVSHCVDFKM